MRWTFAAILAMLMPEMALAGRPELIVDIDFNDEVIIRPRPITEAEVEKLVSDLHASGVQTLLVRMGYLGYFPFRTKLSYPVGFDVEHARRHPYQRNLPPGQLERFIEKRQKDNARYRKVIETFNPPEVFVRAGHRLGMKVIFWLDIFDDGYSGHRSKFLDEHPHCQWTARDGKTRFEGLMSYAWPDARALRVAQAKELLDLGGDGIHCSTGAHCRHLPNVQQNDAYGYEEPVVAEYRQRYGVDIRAATSFDKDAWHTIKGEFMNRLYRELAAVCHERKKELWVGLQLGEYTHMAADPYFGTNVVARYRNLWKELVDQRIADALIVGDYEICSAPRHAYWTAKGPTPPAGVDLFAWAAGHYQPHCKGRTRLYLFGEWLPGSPQALEPQLTKWAQRVAANKFDGIDMHEAMNFESARGMEFLKRMRDQLDGKQLAPSDRLENPRGGITAVTKGPVDLQIPQDLLKGEAQRYGLAHPFQAGPKTGGLFVNRRVERMGAGDFENGCDVILFDDLKTVLANAAIPVSRNEIWTDPTTGEKRLFVTYPEAGGFVPHGAKRADGTPHPHAGSGFAFCMKLGYPMRENGAPRWSDKSLVSTGFRQFEFDGKRFRVVRDDSLPPGKFLRTEDLRWRIQSPGMTMAIPDGEDLLQAVKAYGKVPFLGVARWARRCGVWRPVAFMPVSETERLKVLMEPSLVWDRDGSLLFTARKGDRTQEDAFALRVWRSRDGGANWERIVDVPATLDAGPRAIGTAADGTPFAAGNPVQKDRSYFREALWLWPLNAGRPGIEAPLIVRDGPAEFGPAPKETPWRVDHPNSTVLRLGDGRWHCVLAFRLYRNDLMRSEGAPNGIHEVAGAYLEEVMSRGPAIPAWRFAD